MENKKRRKYLLSTLENGNMYMRSIKLQENVFATDIENMLIDFGPQLTSEVELRGYEMSNYCIKYLTYQGFHTYKPSKLVPFCPLDSISWLTISLSDHQ